MKRYFPLIMIATLLVAGCKNKNGVSGDPRSVLVAFFDRMSKKDIDGATKLATKDSKTTMDMMKKGMQMAEKMKDNPMANGNHSMKDEDPAEAFKDIEIGEAKINGDDATVAFTNKKKGESFDFPLKKEDGSWKVDFSMATLMKMGMEQRGKNGFSGDSTDHNDFTMPNSDSIKAGLEKFDSLMKTLDTAKLNKVKDALKDLEKLKQH